MLIYELAASSRIGVNRTAAVFSSRSGGGATTAGPLISNLIGDKESLALDPVNWWAGTLLLTVALDLSRQHAPDFGRQRPRGPR